MSTLVQETLEKTITKDKVEPVVDPLKPKEIDKIEALSKKTGVSIATLRLIQAKEN
jgi:hypothetical protein